MGWTTDVLATGSTTELRRRNRDVVLRVIRERGSASRTEIAESVGLTNAAVSRITKELIDAGLVEEGERVVLQGQAGRRQVGLRLAGEGAYVLGIAVTLNAREVVLGNGQGEICARIDCADIDVADADSAIRAFASRAKRLLRQSRFDRRRLLGGAISVAGRVDPCKGRIVGPGPLGWEGQIVAATFERQLGMPFVAEGRAAALLQVERDRGLAVGLSDILLLNVGLKIGTAMMVDGNLLRGAESNAFSLGGYAVGRDRTLDDLASGFAILEKLQAKGRSRPKRTDAGTFIRQLVDEPTRDEPVSSAFHQAGAALGSAVRQLATVLSPQLIILAGLVSRQKDYIAGVQSEIADTTLRLSGSQLTTADSAIHLALESHLFNQGLEIDRLMAA